MELSAALQQIGSTVRRVAQQALVETGNRLVDRSPVRTGHFKANWQHGVEPSVPDNELDGVDPDGAATKRALAQSILASKPGLQAFVNNVPYALAIEYGSSQQAPSGVAAVTALEFDSIVAQVAQ